MMLGRSGVFALFALVVGGLTLPASAQNYKAKFTLPYEAHWGTADLPAGDYTVWTEMRSGAPLINIAGNGTTAAIFAGPVEYRDSTDRGFLEVTEVNGTHVVTRFLAGSIGRDYTFRIPKSVSGSGFGAVALKKAVIPASSAQ